MSWYPVCSYLLGLGCASSAWHSKNCRGRALPGMKPPSPGSTLNAESKDGVHCLREHPYNYLLAWYSRATAGKSRGWPQLPLLRPPEPVPFPCHAGNPPAHHEQGDLECPGTCSTAWCVVGPWQAGARSPEFVQTAQLTLRADIQKRGMGRDALRKALQRLLAGGAATCC